MAFSAGDLEATLDLNRSPFIRSLKAAQAAARRANLDQAVGDDGDSFDAAAAKVRGLGDEIDRTRTRSRAPITPSVDTSRLTRYLAVVRQARSRQLEWVQSLRDSTTSIGPFNVRTGTLVKLFGALLPLVTSLAAGLGGLVGSLGAAALGLGAMGVSAAALLAPMVALTAGVIARFKDQSEKAGTAAHSLSRAAGDASKAFQSMTARGADGVMRGLSDALRSMVPTMRALTPVFTNLGRVVGQQFSRLGETFSSDRFTGFFRFITNAAAKAVPQLNTAFIGLSKTLANIAQAAMPFLQSGLRSLAGFMTDLGKSTSNIGQLRSQIGGLVDHLRTWFDLAKNLGSAMVGLFKGMAPAGKELVQWLSEGSRKLAEWANSASGQAQIKAFMADMVPLAKSLINAFGDIGKAMLQWSQLIAPVVRPLVDGLAAIARVVGDVLQAINQLPGPVKTALGALLLFKGPIGTIKLLIGLVTRLGGALKLLTGVGVAKFFTDLAAKAAQAARDIGARLLPTLKKVPDAIKKRLPGGGSGSSGGSFFDDIVAGGKKAGTALFKFGAMAGPPAIALHLLKKAMEEYGEQSTRVLNDTRASTNFRQQQEAFAGLHRSIDTARRGVTRLAGDVQVGAAKVVSNMKGSVGPFRQAANQIGAAAGNAGTRFQADFTSSMSRAINTAKGKVTQGLRGIATAFKQGGTQGAKGLADGIRQGQGQSQAAARQLAQAAVRAARAAGNAMRGAGNAISRLFGQGVNSGRGAASNAGRGLSQAVANAARSAGNALRGVGSQITGLFASGIRSAQGQATGAANGVTNAVEGAFRSVGAGISQAGAALVANFAAGIRGAQAGAVSAAQGVAQAVRNVFPGSEPKDPRSPLRGLGDAGRATIDNFASGLDPRAAASAMRGALSTADLAAVMAGAGGVRYGDRNMTVNPTMHVQSEGDAVGFLRRLELEQRLHGA